MASTTTAFFRSCVAVFQGGGCRAAAFVGAYEEAVRRGVSVIEVAGTSAGSIVAALIGAGAPAAKLRSILEELDFLQFLQTAERSGKRFLAREIIAAVVSPQLSSIWFDQGLYSSARIESWIDERLAEVLGSNERPISFRSLRMPTYIVSTDVSHGRAKVWSQSTTPDESVAEAVRASCSIPIFFQPVAKRYVDGGLLSNLPSFVFADQHPPLPLSSRLLAFTLSSDDPAPGEWTTLGYLGALVNAVIDGSQRLQLDLQPGVHVIEIPTGAIRSTDFAKMTKAATRDLIDRGIRATQKFFDEELMRVRGPRLRESVCLGLEEMYARVTEGLDLTLQKVVIAQDDSAWVYSLFPTLFCWRSRGVPISVLLPEHGDAQGDGTYRRNLLRALGITVTEMPGASTVPVQCYILVPNDPSLISAVIGVEKQSYTQTIEAVHYNGFLDASVVNIVLAKVEELIGALSSNASLPRIERGEQGGLLDLLRTVGQYSKPGIDLKIEDVPLSKLISLAQFVREYKYTQIEHFVDLYRKADIPLFEPSFVQFGDGQTSIITPPVVEAAGDNFILIEGSTRAVFCRDRGVSQIKCVVVRGVRDPLPSKTYPFKDVLIVGRTLPPTERYNSFDYANFRPIERRIHRLDSLQSTR